MYHFDNTLHLWTWRLIYVNVKVNGWSWPFVVVLLEPFWCRYILYQLFWNISKIEEKYVHAWLKYSRWPSCLYLGGFIKLVIRRNCPRHIGSWSLNKGCAFSCYCDTDFHILYQTSAWTHQCDSKEYMRPAILQSYSVDARGSRKKGAYSQFHFFYFSCK